MKIFRTLLFTPGNNPRMIEKAQGLQADAVILDLEDAVPVAEKAAVRLTIGSSIHAIKSSGHDVFVRINSFSTDRTTEDLRFSMTSNLDGIVLPKVEGKRDILRLERLIRHFEKTEELKPKSTSIIPIVETAVGVLKAYEIASTSKRVIGIGFGAIDFTRDMGTKLTKDGMELLLARSHIALAANACGIQAIDTPWIDLTDLEGLIRDAKFAKQLGYKGKLLVHPNQISPVNEIFSPSEEEVEYANKIVHVFEKAREAGMGATSLDGKMIDTANYRQAKELLSLAQSIPEKKKKTTEPGH